MGCGDFHPSRTFSSFESIQWFSCENTEKPQAMLGSVNGGVLRQASQRDISLPTSVDKENCPQELRKSQLQRGLDTCTPLRAPACTIAGSVSPQPAGLNVPGTGAFSFPLSLLPSPAPLAPHPPECSILNSHNQEPVSVLGKRAA